MFHRFQVYDIPPRHTHTHTHTHTDRESECVRETLVFDEETFLENFTRSLLKSESLTVLTLELFLKYPVL